LPKGGSGRKEMKTHTLITGIAVLFLATGAAHAADKCVNPDGTQDPVCTERNDEDWGGEPRQRVTVAPPLPPGPPPLGWVYGPYTICGDPPRCSTGVVNVPADGLNGSSPRVAGYSDLGLILCRFWIEAQRGLVFVIELFSHRSHLPTFEL